MSTILDSGERRQFSSGAVRDISEGKGRTDLMPLYAIYRFCKYVRLRNLRESINVCPNPSEYVDSRNGEVPEFDISVLCRTLDYFIYHGNTDAIFYLVLSFINSNYPDIETALLDLSIHYEEGAKKYCERNWEKGINAHCFVDSAIRHGLKFLRGDDDEPHGRAFMWNIFGLVWTLAYKPEFNDLPFTNSTICSERHDRSKKERDNRVQIG